MELEMIENLIDLPDGSHENIGDFDSFYCYYCLEKFKTYEEKIAHEQTHDKSEKSAQMNQI